MVKAGQLPCFYIAEYYKSETSGDLTGEKIKIRTKDEAGSLAESINLMPTSLREIAIQLQEKSQVVASSAAELTASAENVAAGSNETASAITQVAGNVDQVTVNAQRISDVSKQAAGYAREGLVTDMTGGLYYNARGGRGLLSLQ